MKQYICLFLLLFSLVCCSDDDKNDIKKNITIEVFNKLELSENEYPDVGAKVFSYYDKYSIDFSLTTYDKVVVL